MTMIAFSTLTNRTISQSKREGSAIIMAISSPASRHCLHGWKQIARYFGLNERTMRRWEQTRQLPVRRYPGRQSSVFAYEDELEAWRDGTFQVSGDGSLNG
ncbi:MAG: hypothetical protein KGL21_02150 [Alphaproteobacteria bacterium]|nr:hypothetical protein [Alphaproteobacteria bacterium]